MFNLAQYEERLTDRARDILARPATDWLNTVDHRYASHLLRVSHGRLDRLRKDDGEGHFNAPLNSTAELRDIAGVIYNAANLIACTVKVADPARRQAEMELYAEANTPKHPIGVDAKGNVVFEKPPEPDAALRLRVMVRAKDIGAAIRTLEQINVSSGAELDKFADCYGLERE